MYILGISCYYHDAAAVLLKDVMLVAAAEEERFTRKKHDPSFPHNAIQYCLAEGNVKLSNLDYIVFYDKPFLKFERLLETYLAFAPKGFRSFKWRSRSGLARNYFRKICLLTPYDVSTKLST